MRVCIPMTSEGQVDPRWGRAANVAVAEVHDGSLTSWTEFAVGWDRLHDQTTEGGHHSRIARFILDNRIDTVAADHMGEPMIQMLERMGIAVRLGVGGDARQAAISAPGTTAA
jgi:predicted Fe-Mo cluster-binding NifX family protein